MGVNPSGLAADLAIDAKLSLLAVVLGTDLMDALRQYVQTGKVEFDLIPEWVAEAIAGPIGEAERIMGQPLFELLIRAPAGVALSAEAGAQEAQAVQMVQRMIGFATALPFAISGLKSGLNAAMGGNAPAALLDAIGKIPEDLGVNWALGTVMANIFELSTGRPLAEAINKQTRPFRFEWPQVRALLRQGHITEAEASTLFANIGIRDSDMGLAQKLDRVLLSLGDLQQAYLYGLKDEAWIRDYLGVAGLDDEDIDVAVALYLTRAQTTGAGELRSVAQRGYLEDHLSEAQYRALLTSANVPKDSIDLEVEAANLTKQWGRLSLTVSEVKTAFQAGRIDSHGAMAHLLESGYTEEDAQTIIDSWAVAAKVGKLRLSESRILSYLLGGIYTRAQAYAALLASGMRADDAAFLADNPSSFGGVFRYPLSAPTILAALKAGDIDDARARELLAGLNMAPAEIDLRVKVAEHGGRRATAPVAGSKVLSEAEILELLRFGLAAPSWALTELSRRGYSDADAGALVALTLTRRDGNAPADWTELS